MDDKALKAGESVRQIRRLLGDLLRVRDDSRQPVADILQHLEVVDEFVQQARPMRVAKVRPAGGRQTAATYAIEKKKNAEEVLVERRANGTSQPFRCPRYLYDGIVRVLATAEEPLEFEEVLQGVTKVVPDPAEFLVRVAVRFLMSLEPPLVARHRKRYRPARKGKFQTDARAAWTTLAKASKNGD